MVQTGESQQSYNEEMVTFSKDENENSKKTILCRLENSFFFSNYMFRSIIYFIYFLKNKQK